MPGERTQLAQLREARRIMARMRDRLLDPTFEALRDCANDLGQVRECLQRLDAQSAVWKGASRPALEAEVTEIRRSVRCVEALLANAGRFYAGWLRLLKGDQGPPNYTAAGPLARPGSQVAAHTVKLVIHG